jgi:hypothetical protein
MKFSNIEVELKGGFVMREIHPLRAAEIEDMARAKAGSKDGSRFRYYSCREKFVESCVAFPAELVNSEEFGGRFECNEENKRILYDMHDYFVNTALLNASMVKIIEKRAEQLKNCLPGLRTGEAEQAGKQ